MYDWDWNEYNDDLLWAGLAFVRGHRITGNQTYLNQAQDAFNRVYDRGWDDALGDGIWWDIRERDKNALSNSPAVILGCLIYERTVTADTWTRHGRGSVATNSLAEYEILELHASMWIKARHDRGGMAWEVRVVARPQRPMAARTVGGAWARSRADGGVAVHGASSAFVGREQELSTIAQVLGQPPALIVVEGESGIGKTRLVSELRSHPASAQHRFVVGACQRIREPFPLGPVIEAVRVLGDELAGKTLSPVAGALRPLLPELAPFLPVAPEALDDRVAERHRVFRALLDVLGSVGPTVLVLEDVHWADEHTLDFVTYLMRDLPPALSLLLTFRGEDVEPRVRATVARLPTSVNRTHVVLGPLDVPQTGALAAAILGLDRVSEGFATYLREQASGVPFAIEELLALLRERGTLLQRGGDWARKTLTELDVPAGIRDQVLERFGRLSDAARAVVEAAAVLQVPVPMSVLAATCRVSDAQARRGLEMALESGMLVERANAFGFRHVLAAQAVYDAMPGPRRQNLHARAAVALATLDSVPLGQRAHHLRNAGRLGEWADVAEEAADQATALGHDDEAARLLEDVLRGAPLGVEQCARLAVKLGRAAMIALHAGDDTAGLLSDALAPELPRTVQGELRLLSALLLERSGADVRLLRPLFTAAVDDLRDRPELQAQAMVALSIPCVPGSPLAEHKRWLRRILAVLPTVGDPAVHVGLLGKVAMVQMVIGDPRWRQFTDRIVEWTGGNPRQRAEVLAFVSVGQEACYAGHLGTAAQMLPAGLAGAVASGYRGREMWLRAAVALLDYCRGAWDGLAERAEVLIDELADLVYGRADVEVVAGCLALARGDLDQASQRLDQVTQMLERRSGYDLLPVAANAQVRLATGSGDLDRAVAQARRFLGAVESVPLLVSAAWALPAMTEAMAAGGRLSDARDLVTRWGRHLSDINAPLAPAAVPHAHGVVAAAGRHWRAAAGRFLAAATQYDRLHIPYEAAQAREQAAAALFYADDDGAGAAELRIACTAFQRLGATWDLDRVLATARHHGVSVPARHRRGRRGYGAELSPREREVVFLAASGRTNREIAEVLFTSPNTVKKQLGAAMRKLGVGSRGAIASRLDVDLLRPSRRRKLMVRSGHSYPRRPAPGSPHVPRSL